jgi:hypothetical protein
MLTEGTKELSINDELWLASHTKYTLYLYANMALYKIGLSWRKAVELDQEIYVYLST